jgi:hypothetical protein
MSAGRNWRVFGRVDGSGTLDVLCASYYEWVRKKQSALSISAAGRSRLKDENFSVVATVQGLKC